MAKPKILANFHFPWRRRGHEARADAQGSAPFVGHRCPPTGCWGTAAAGLQPVCRGVAPRNPGCYGGRPRPLGCRQHQPRRLAVAVAHPARMVPLAQPVSAVTSQSEGVAPSALILMFSPSWMAPARLPEALADAGFQVGSYCHANSFLAKSAFNSYLVAIPAAGSAFPNLVAAVRAQRPDILIPACELAIRFLHNIVDAAAGGRLDGTFADVLHLVERSLGDPALQRRANSKIAAHGVAQELGIAVPRQRVAASFEAALDGAAELGYPLVVKPEFGFAGSGVAICTTPGELQQACQIDPRGGGAPWVLQQYQPGARAMQASACWQGEVLETITLAKERTHPEPTGPSAVVRMVDAPEAEAAARELVRHYRVSGFCSIDFVLDEPTGRAVFLEMNMRPSAGCTLGRLWGRDHGKALSCRLRGVDFARAAVADGPQRVALFPNEWLRDPHSVHLSRDYHDVPWRDPALLKAYVDALVK